VSSDHDNFVIHGSGHCRSPAVIARSDTSKPSVSAAAQGALPARGARPRRSEVVLVSVPVRIATLLVAFLAVVAGAVFIVVHYLLGAGGPAEV